MARSEIRGGVPADVSTQWLAAAQAANRTDLRGAGHAPEIGIIRLWV